jgi:opacity protein-like surface antigen
MKLSKIALTVIVAAAVATPALRTIAADSAKDSGPYLTLDAGVNIMQDANTVDSSGKTGKAKFDTGWRVGLMGGYNINKYVGVELETGFIDNGLKDSDRWIGTIPVLGNVVFRYENASGFVPYIGVGAGGAYSMVQGGGGDDQSDFVFAYQAKAGVAYEITPCMAVDVGYKFFGTADEKFGGTKVKDIYAHFIGLSFTFKF